MSEYRTSSWYTWELGGGLGHVVPAKRLMARLNRNGHQVHAAIRNLAAAEKGLAGIDFSCWQAPVMLRPPAPQFTASRSFAEVLFSACFSDVDDLAGRVCGWLSIFEASQPRVVIADHSPTALLAARITRTPAVLLGAPFTIPPRQSPFPNFLPDADGRAAETEATVLDIVNRVLEKHHAERLTELHELFSSHSRILTSYPAIDCYAPREGDDHVGVWFGDVGDAPAWPKGDGRKVVAYLKPFPVIEVILRLLNEWKLPSLIYCPEVPAELQQKYASEQVRFCKTPIDLLKAGEEADLAILNGTHGSTAAMCYRRTPMLHVPIVLEQQLTAAKVVNQGWGVIAKPSDAAGCATALQTLLRGLDEERFQLPDTSGLPTPEEALDKAVAIVNSVR